MKQRILCVKQNDFENLTLQIFQYQANNNVIYKHFLDLLKIHPSDVVHVSDIPFLPIALFKQHAIKTGTWEAEIRFTSSGTTGQTPSTHHIRNLNFYLTAARQGFEGFYGSVEEYCFLALLPSYLERSGSSLIAMVDAFIQRSKYKESGFFLYDFDALAQQLQSCIQANIPTVLIGVSFALLDFAEQYPMDLSKVIIMETGGMKGKRKELIRKELHEQLGQAFQQRSIHSEYGMTELLSQAYAMGGERFLPSSTMRILISDITDPRSFLPDERTGKINVIDLANFDSCSFIATEDLGKRWQDGSFEILGRVDNSDLRGCNLMVEVLN
ncbi:MAG: long-chain fatty acid--CoA ligase [Saprospiraceae bacterium]|nr:long-chain fatty acid--CoA ligase [Saprospiraceae bacterium]